MKSITRAIQKLQNRGRSERLKTKRIKQSFKSPAKHLSEAQISFNRYIRIRDYFEPCRSCGRTVDEVEREHGWKAGGCWDSGHYKSRGAKPQLRFNLFNVHKQCKKCNGGGKFSAKDATVSTQYKANLIEKIGIEKVLFLDNNNETDIHKKDIEYLKRVKSIFNRKYRIYKKRFRTITE